MLPSNAFWISTRLRANRILVAHPNGSNHACMSAMLRAPKTLLAADPVFSKPTGRIPWHSSSAPHPIRMM